MSTQRQHCTPLVISDGTLTPMRRVPLAQREFNEDWFQELLFSHPELIPIEEIEPIFGPLIPIARELPTPVGPVDVAYVSPSGYVTLVETKLWRNPEARRQVVAQIVDYAAAISKWSYDDLVDAVRRASPAASEIAISDPLLEKVTREAEVNRAEFIDNIARNLSRGRLLLLIAGDGISEGVEHLTETLSRSPHLGFTLGLLELALFRSQQHDGMLLVQPRLLARTREVVRAVVELRAGISPTDVRIAIPTAPESGAERRKLTDEVFLERLAEKQSADTVRHFRDFLAKAESLGIAPQYQDASMSLFWRDTPNNGRYSAGSVFKDGTVDTYFVLHHLRREGVDEQVGREYLQALSLLVPGALVRKQFNNSQRDPGEIGQVFLGDRKVTLADLLPRADEWLAAIEKLVRATEIPRS